MTPTRSAVLLIDILSACTCSLPAEQRTIPLSTIGARTRLGVDGVEFLLMKTLSLKLIEGIIDQVDGHVQVCARYQSLPSMHRLSCCHAVIPGSIDFFNQNFRIFQN